jgi:predicted Zn-dependent protease
MFLRKLSILGLFATLISLYGCGALGGEGGGGFNLFTPEQDLELGRQVQKQIESDPQQFPILPEQGNEEVYRYIRAMTNKILNSGKVQYRNEFAWEVKIIDDDETLNAFCTPGGFIYVYTGLIKFLDSEDELAGVMGHEIAHAALRHSTRQMTKQYGLATLVSVVTGNSDPGMIEQVALGLVSLRFSRSHETESDEHSVIYLCATDYNSTGAAGFFRKVAGEGGSPPEFLSTHPDPGNRVQKINAKANSLSCGKGETYRSEYQRIKSLLK